MKSNPIIQPAYRNSTNRWGYRGVEPQPRIPWALGCSHTYGWELEVRDTWAYKLGKLLESPIVNFGTPAGSIDSMIRIHKAWYEELKPPVVFMQIPVAGRHEVNGKPGITFIKFLKDKYPNHPEIDKYNERWDEEVKLYNTKLKSLLDSFDCPVFYKHSWEIEFIDTTPDGHLGPQSHTLLAETYYNEYTRA